MKKLTQEEVIERLKVTNPSVRVIGKYINASVKLQVECKKCGYQWDAKYGDLSKGHACPECGKKKCGMSQRMSHEEFISRINEMFDNSMLVADIESVLVISGNGEVIEPDYDFVAIGSGGNYAYAAAHALFDHTDMDASSIAEEALHIASDICVYTNSHISVEKL